MTAKFIQRGDSIDHTPAEDISAGDVVVLNSRCGVAKLDIKAGTLGALAVTGVYEVPKAAVAIGAGTEVFWDAAAGKATSQSSTAWLGIAAADAAANAPTVLVRLSW